MPSSFVSTLALTLTAALGCAKPPQPDISASPDGPDTTSDTNPSCDFEADPNKNYVGHSPDECALMKFMCAEGKEYFADDCGCGCVGTEG